MGATPLVAGHIALAMTRRPFGPQDRAWLLSRLFVLGLALLVHPLPFDLRRFDLVVPAHSAKIAYIVFECLQTVVFAAAIYFGDMLPGMRWVIAYYRRLMVEVREAPLAIKFVKATPLALGAAIAVWLIVSPLETVVNAVPPGSPRFCAATACFIVERFAVIIGFIIIANASDDDDPGVRRNSIARSLAMLTRQVQVQAIVKAPVTTNVRSNRVAPN